MIGGNYSLQNVKQQPHHHFTVFHHPDQGPGTNDFPGMRREKPYITDAQKPDYLAISNSLHNFVSYEIHGP